MDEREYRKNVVAKSRFNMNILGVIITIGITVFIYISTLGSSQKIGEITISQNITWLLIAALIVLLCFWLICLWIIMYLEADFSKLNQPCDSDLINQLSIKSISDQVSLFEMQNQSIYKYILNLSKRNNNLGRIMYFLDYQLFMLGILCLMVIWFIISGQSEHLSWILVIVSILISFIAAGVIRLINKIIEKFSSKHYNKSEKTKLSKFSDEISEKKISSLPFLKASPVESCIAPDIIPRVQNASDDAREDAAINSELRYQHQWELSKMVRSRIKFIMGTVGVIATVGTALFLSFKDNEGNLVLIDHSETIVIFYVPIQLESWIFTSIILICFFFICVICYLLYSYSHREALIGTPDKENLNEHIQAFCPHIIAMPVTGFMG
ncbi:MAG: hypothetical protein LBL85_04280 [Methanocalculaceae archaeon]|nr:hypothetical protein [Methanocalculaceae archaeon]